MSYNSKKRSYKSKKVEKTIKNKQRQKDIMKENKPKVMTQEECKKPIPKKEKQEKPINHLKKYNDTELDDDIYAAFKI